MCPTSAIYPMGGQGFGESLRGFSAPCGLGFGCPNSVKGLRECGSIKDHTGKIRPAYFLTLFFYAKRTRTLDSAACIGYNFIMGCRFFPASGSDFAVAGNASVSHVIINLWTYVNVKQKVRRTKKPRNQLE